MVKAKLFDASGKEKGSVELPKLISGIIRRDVLAKVFESQKREQPYGSMVFAGRNYSAAGILRRKRHAWKVTYGKGISRAPRKIMSRHGQSFQWVGASANYSRGGGVAHPHRPEENQFRKVNKKELLIAMGSALSGTFDAKSLEKKYDVKVTNSAIVADTKVLELKTKKFIEFLEIVFGDAFQKLLKQKRVRAGSGKSRGRKYKSNAGLLFVIASDEKMNRSGVAVVKAKELSVSDLSPNGQPGRFAIYTEKALKEIEGAWKK
ncbi:MAG: 50S ribosomal protein L4 [archaeon]